jgi:hypothetical protein
MFKNLISVIGPLNAANFTLTVPDPDLPPAGGEFIPNCVEPEELTLPSNAKEAERIEGYRFPFHHTTASCAAASVSISG